MDKLLMFSEFFSDSKNSLKFLLTLCVFIVLVISSFIFKSKFLKLETSSRFVKILQFIVKSIHIPIVLFFTLNILSNEDNFFLQYIDEYFIVIIRKLNATGNIFLMWFCFANLTANVENILSNKDNDALERKLLTIVMKCIKFFSFIVITLMILRLFGFNIVSVIEKAGGSTAIITGAFLLIYKSQVSNVLSGLLILLNKTFKIGNRIVLPEKKISGKILDISLNKIKILSDDQKVITFPNSYLSNTPYYNLSECENSYIKETFCINHRDYGQIGIVIKSIYDIVDDINEVNKNLPVNIYVNEISDRSALLLNVEFFIKTTDSGKVRSTKQFLLLKSLDVLNKNSCHIFEEYR